MSYDFNARRAERVTSERSFTLGPFTFKRRMSVPPETILGFRRDVADAGDDDMTQLTAAEKVSAALCEPTATHTDGTVWPFDDAWHFMRFEGDEYGVLDVDDLLAVSRWLIEGVVERPTGQPSASAGGSTTPAPGMPSTDASPSSEPASTISTPDGLSTLSIPS